MQGADCLTGNCHAEQMQWAFIAVLTGLCPLAVYFTCLARFHAPSETVKDPDRTG